MLRSVSSLLALLLVAWVSACTQFPELDGRVSAELAEQAPPQLVPLGPLLARAQNTTRAAPAALETLPDRAAALRARAARLRGPIIPPAQRARMLRGLR